MMEKPADTRKFFRELFGLFLLFWALLLLLSILTFDANDPSLNHVVSVKNGVHNKAGLFGAYASGFLNDVFGVVALLWPLVFAALGAAYISAAFCMQWWRWCGLFLLTVCFLVLGSAWDLSIGDLAGGGMVGSTLYNNSARYLSPAGSFLLWLFVLLIGLQLTFNFSWIAVWNSWLNRLKKQLAPLLSDMGTRGSMHGKLAVLGKSINIAPLLKIRENLREKTRDLLGALRQKFPRKDVGPIEDINLEDINDTDIHEINSDLTKNAPDRHDIQLTDSAPQQTREDTPCEPDIVIPPQTPTAKISTERDEADIELPASSTVAQTAVPKPRPAVVSLPPLDLLSPPKPDTEKTNRENLEEKGQKLMDCLKDFDVDGDLVRITPGPVVTRYEVRPAKGIRVSRISNLSDDLGRAMSALSVRIQAPIPGCDTVGIEVPNAHREMVNFLEIARTEQFARGCGPLTMILGKDISGQPYVADLSRMPHLLVAGATGSGKSVCLNCILISLLYRLRPEEMQLLLVDPKRVEMTLYTDAPHLVHPVVTEVSDAKNALDWAVHEMDRRYTDIATLGAKNIASYNEKIASFKDNPPAMFKDLRPFPYLVIVIDELADLMMTASREVETSIIRLAQLARAAGIHMILATQRPSVNVVTPLIKSNIPFRISFHVTSKIDSRIILDQMGAEHLLGNGDMLFKPSSGAPLRLHGCYLPDEECAAVVDFWKSQLEPDYKIDFTKWGNDKDAKGADAGGNEGSDKLYGQAREFVMGLGQASISLLQRRFKIGFNRAARIMDQFEKEGFIGPPDGSKPRKVIK